ncbi:hypothetical protein FOY91_19815, partial [Sphingomonas solaris]
NGFGEGTAASYACGTPDLAARAAAFGMPAVAVAGTDFFAVHDPGGEAGERGRGGKARPPATHAIPAPARASSGADSPGNFRVGPSRPRPRPQAVAQALPSRHRGWPWRGFHHQGAATPGPDSRPGPAAVCRGAQPGGPGRICREIRLAETICVRGVERPRSGCCDRERSDRGQKRVPCRFRHPAVDARHRRGTGEAGAADRDAGPRHAGAGGRHDDRRGNGCGGLAPVHRRLRPPGRWRVARAGEGAAKPRDGPHVAIVLRTPS